MTTVGIGDTGVVLWSTVSGVRCTYARHQTGLPFEVTVLAGPVVVKRRRFERERDAFGFAIAEMHAAFLADAAEPA